MQKVGLFHSLHDLAKQAEANHENDTVVEIIYTILGAMAVGKEMELAATMKSFIKKPQISSNPTD